MKKWKNQTRRACNKLQSSGIVCARGGGGKRGRGGGGRKETVSREEKLGDMRDKRMLSTAVNALSLCTRIRIDNVVSFKGCIIISLRGMKKRGE